MQNVHIQIVNEVFHLLDKNGAIILFGDDWDEVQDFVYGDYNIQYEPKDLIFNLFCDDDYGSFVYFEVKYGSFDGDLGSHNVINLPQFINSEEFMECHFGYNEKMSEKEIIDALVAVGATYQKSLRNKK